MQPQPLPRFARCWGVSRHGTEWVIVQGVRASRRMRYTTCFRGPALAALAQEDVHGILPDLAAGKGVAVTGIPAGQSLSRPLVTPFSSRKKAEKVFASLLDIQIPFPVESCAAAYAGIREQDGRVHAQAAAVRSNVLDAYLEELHSAHIAPAVCDHEAVACWDQARTERPFSRWDRRILCIITPDTTLLVLGSRDRFISSTSILTGAQKLFPAVSGTQPAAAEKWTHEVNHAIAAWKNTQGLGEFEWCWSCWDEPGGGILQQLADRLESPPTGFTAIAEPEGLAARAYIRRAAQPSEWSMNLLTGPRTHPVLRQQAQRKQRASALTIMSAGLVLAAAGIAEHWAAAAPIQQMDTEITDLAMELSGMQNVPYGQEVLIVRRAFESRATKGNRLTETAEHRRTELLEAILKVAEEAGVTLQKLELNPDFLRIEGAADDWNRCDPMARALERQGYKVLVDRQPAGSDELVHFTMEGTPAS